MNGKKICTHFNIEKRYYENEDEISNKKLKIIEINYYKGKTIDIKIIENYLDHMLI